MYTRMVSSDVTIRDNAAMATCREEILASLEKNNLDNVTAWGILVEVILDSYIQATLQAGQEEEDE